jgi:SNF2 family DNA or RNA helicase
MKLILEKSKNRISVITLDPNEIKKLKDFPGLLQDGLFFFMPTEPRTAYNLVSRLKAKFPKIKVDPEVEAAINVPFRLREIPPDFKFHTEPKDFQRIALRYAYSVRNCGLLLEPGMGKTKTVLDYIALMRFEKSLIVCPKPLLFVWEDERQLHRPDKSIYVVQSTDWNEERAGIEHADIVVVNYNKAVTLAGDLVDLGFDFIGLDEALIKNPSSGRTKALTWLSRRIPFRMLMSGTLVNNSPLDVFAPVRFLEPSLVGTSFFNFEQEYTVQAGKKVDGKYVGPRFVVGYKKVPEVKSILESVSIVMTKEEWLKLPPKKFIDIWVQPSEHQRKFSLDLASNYIANMWDKTIEVDNPLSVLCKLIQAANGFVYLSKKSEAEELDDSEAKQEFKRETIYFLEQPKLMKLLELLQGELKDRRVMIWYNMTAEGDYIETLLQHHKITCVRIKGGEKDVGGKVRSYNNETSHRVLLCQAKSVNYGITVLGKSGDEEKEEESADGLLYPSIESRVFTQIFYSLNFSLEVYLQQQDRIHRLGQEHECEYYRIFCNLEAERKVKEKIDEKMSIRGQILEDVIHSLGLQHD